MASSVTFAVLEEGPFNRLRKDGLWLMDCSYEAEALEEAGSDATCGHSCGWDPITAQCSRDARAAVRTNYEYRTD